MNLNDFSKGKTNDNYAKQEDFTTQINEDSKKRAEDVINKYSGYSEDDLTSEIVKTIMAQKQQGVYNKQAVLNSINSLSAFISPADQQKIKDLLERVDHD